MTGVLRLCCHVCAEEPAADTRQKQRPNNGQTTAKQLTAHDSTPKIFSMSVYPQVDLTNAERFLDAGDYKQARELALKLKASADKMSEQDISRVKRILAATGTDPAVVVGFLFTFGVIVFLLIKYVL